MSEFGARVHGVAELLAAFAKMELAAQEAALRIVERGQAVVESAAKREFTTSHSAGTSTPAQAGEPPSVISGTLRRGIKSDRPAALGVQGAVGHVYPTAIYSRRQELGGGFVPPRPYMAPAHERVKGELERIAVEEWGRVTRRA